MWFHLGVGDICNTKANVCALRELVNLAGTKSILQARWAHSGVTVDCFVVSQLSRVARPVGRLKLGSKTAQLYVGLNIIHLCQQANHVSSGLIRH